MRPALHARALALRATGLSYAAIGARLGFSRQAAHHLLTYQPVVRGAARLDDAVVSRFLALRTPRGTGGRLAWRGAV